MSYYISNPNANIPVIKVNPKFRTIDELYNLLQSSGWDEMTTFLKSQWNMNNKCSGQCNATVLLVKEYFGGDIISYPNPSLDKNGHFFNRINGVDIDLTADQFNPRLTGYNQMNKIGNFGKYKWLVEKSAYILKLKLGL